MLRVATGAVDELKGEVERVIVQRIAVAAVDELTKAEASASGAGVLKDEIDAVDVFDADRMGRNEVDMSRVDKFIAIEELESIARHMKEAYNLILSGIEGLPADRAQTLFGIATRLRADIGLLRGMLRAMGQGGSRALVRSPTLVSDIRRLGDKVQDIVKLNGISERALNAVMPVLGMLLYVVAAYYFPDMNVLTCPWATTNSRSSFRTSSPKATHCHS